MNRPEPLFPPCLVTERLILRAYRRADAAALMRLIGNLAVSRWLAKVPHPYGRADAEAFLDQAIGLPPEAGAHFAIESEGRLIGGVGIHRESAWAVESGAFAFGYWLGEPYWGRGLAREAAGAALGFACGMLDIPMLTACYFEGNLASRRILDGLGFRDVGAGQGYCRALGCERSNRRMRLDRLG